MSHLGYFKSIINNWHKINKITPKVKKEMKEAIKQFEYSKWVGDFDNEDKNEIKMLEYEFKKMYEIAYS